MKLTGACAVVTGGGHGIGRALAERLSREGAWWWSWTSTRTGPSRVAARLDGIAVGVDVADPGAMAGLVRTAEAAFGPVAVFCSNAGITDMGDGFGPSDLAQIDRIVAINLLAHVWAAQAVIPSMVQRGGGYLVQTISSAALITGPSGVGYTLTKHGALGFVEWVVVNYAHLGIQVTCLCPNAVNTGMLGRNEDDEARSAAPGDDSVTQNIGEVVEPELCADMTLEAMAGGRFLHS